MHRSLQYGVGAATFVNGRGEEDAEERKGKILCRGYMSPSLVTKINGQQQMVRESQLPCLPF